MAPCDEGDAASAGGVPLTALVRLPVPAPSVPARPVIPMLELRLLETDVLGGYSVPVSFSRERCDNLSIF